MWGFFSDLKDSINDKFVEADCERAKRSGLYEASSHRNGCEYCVYCRETNSSTGLTCIARNNLTVCANLTCDYFSK